MDKYVDGFWVYGSFLKQKQFWIKSFIILLVFTFMFVITQMTHASVDGNGVNVESIISDPGTIYERYKENSFQLMTKPYESDALFGGAIEEMYNNISGTIKNMIWSAVRAVGAFNTTMVKYLFNLDLVSQVKQPFVNLTASIAQSMIGVAGTIGISIVALLMVIKFAVEQRFRSAFILFLMTVFTFTGLAILKDVNSADSVATTILNVDKAIETSFVQVNPAFINGDKVAPSTSQTPEKQMKQAGDLIATQVFYTNVFEPYLLTNYGTSDIKKIRSKSVEYENKRYDRIQILLDNDLTTEDGKKIHEAVTDYEADENKNKAIQYFNSSDNSIFLLFYLVVNLLQTIVYFMLSMFRNAVAFLQILFLPLAPIMLLFGLFIESVNAFKNYTKGSLILMFLKALLSFLAIVFASYLSIGFKIAQGNMDAWQKILTLIVYICLPFVLYAMRHFIFMLLVGELNGRQMVRLMTNPFAFNRMARQQAKAYRQRQNSTRQQKQDSGKQSAKEKQKEAEKRGEQDLGLNNPKESKQQQRSQKRQNQASTFENEVMTKSPDKSNESQSKHRSSMSNRKEKAQGTDIPTQASGAMNHARSQKRTGNTNATEHLAQQSSMQATNEETRPVQAVGAVVRPGQRVGSNTPSNRSKVNNRLENKVTPANRYYTKEALEAQKNKPMNQAPSRLNAQKSNLRQSGQRNEVTATMRNQAINRRQLGAKSSHRLGDRTPNHRQSGMRQHVAPQRNLAERHVNQQTNVSQGVASQATHYRQSNRMRQAQSANVTAKVQPNRNQKRNQTLKASIPKGRPPKQKRMLTTNNGKKG